MYVFAKSELIKEFFKILHGIGSIVRGKWAWLSDWVDMTHVSDRRSDVLILIFDEVIDFFIGGIGSGNQVVFVEVRVIRPRCVMEVVPKPLKGWVDLKSKFCILRATAFIANNNNKPSTQILIKIKIKHIIIHRGGRSADLTKYSLQSTPKWSRLQ